jgi:Tol biopolymer transport system component
MSPRVSPDHKKFIYSTYIVDGTASVEDQRSSYEEILKLCSVSKSGQTKVDILDRVISTPDDPTSIVWIIWDSASNQVIYTTETPSSLFGGSVSRTPSSKIYQVDIATKNKRLLLDDGKLYALKYLSEDGSRLYMEGPISPGGMLPTETSYVVFNLQTGVTKPISETGIEAEIGMDIVDVGGAKVIATPNLSPDSSKIAFFGGSPSDTRKLDEIPVHERNTLWVQNADGTNMRALTNEEVVRSPRWLPDGNEIVFLDTSGSVYEYSPAVKKVNVSTKQVTTLSESSGTGKPQVFAHSWGFLDWITCSD